MLKSLASFAAPLAGIWSKFGLPSGKLGRLRDLLFASLVSMALLSVYLLDPVDQLIWMVQSKLGDSEPSGEIVFVGAESNTTEPNFGEHRQDLARVLRQLDRDGASNIYIDLVFTAPSTNVYDQELHDAIEDLGPKVTLVDQLTGPLKGEGNISRTVDEIGGSSKRVISRHWANYLGYVWTRETGHLVDGKHIPSLAASLANVQNETVYSFNIDYSFPSEEIQSFTIQDILSEQGSNSHRNFSGKSVVIGERSSQTNSSQKIPGDYAAPYSYVSIYAAETIKSGKLAITSRWLSLSLTLLSILAIIIFVKREKFFKTSFIVLYISQILLLYVCSRLGIRVEVSYSVVALLIYGICRSRARLRNRLSKIDPETKLPKLRALEEALTEFDDSKGHIVVARIHGYENVLKTLERRERTQYIMRLVDRVRAADSHLAIYFEGHNFAWQSAEDDPDALIEHLEGLRAIFAAPIVVADKSVDAGISFGVARIDSSGDTRLAAALAAAEDSSEAEAPICFAPDTSRSDELWDISLRARIDEAMKTGEIYCVYQPKIDIRNGSLKGVEALVRWQDPERGFISPMKFIAQCEKAGRMEHLTRYVLQSACNSGRLLHFRGQGITMSVNISATLLSNMRIVSLVSNVLQTTGFPAESLILEITETSRIGDHATAAAVLGELKALGALLSIDDFGVGAANFETLYQLPFDELKIDRLFVGDLVNSVKAKAICASIVAMGREAQMDVVAEGVENPKTLELLEEIGCYTVQGFALSRPMSISNLLKTKTLWKKHESRA